MIEQGIFLGLIMTQVFSILYEFNVDFIFAAQISAVFLMITLAVAIITHKFVKQSKKIGLLGTLLVFSGSFFLGIYYQFLSSFSLIYLIGYIVLAVGFGLFLTDWNISNEILLKNNLLRQLSLIDSFGFLGGAVFVTVLIILDQ